jgi:type II secretory pathway pseudopilin PulG
MPGKTKNKLPTDINDELALLGALPSTEPKEKVTKRHLWLITAMALLLVLGFAALYVRAQAELKKSRDQAMLLTAQLESYKNPSARAQQENQDLIKKVGELVALPNDEQPTIATVSDPAKLADQPFFARTKVGDKVLIYQKAGKAILYRPAEHKIIELAPLNIEQSTDDS